MTVRWSEPREREGDRETVRRMLQGQAMRSLLLIAVSAYEIELDGEVVYWGPEAERPRL